MPHFQVGGQPGMFLNSALKCSLTVQHFLLFFLLISTQAGNRLVWSLFVLGYLCRIVTFLSMEGGGGRLLYPFDKEAGETKVICQTCVQVSRTDTLP